ncbi:hypothetical protein ACT3TH_02395 [Psychrobacter sp. AOP22-C1-C5]|uniref:hypothetical protein n=1 Tax=Psychrobacter sp. AOP22-C1-C5 TaxID=3457716 RepID=UPI004035A4C2
MLQKLKISLNPLGYKVEQRDGSDIFISHCCVPWVVRVIKEEDFYYPVFYFRTYFGLGERTDLHEVVPMVIVLVFRAIGKFSFRFLGQHNQFSGIEDELYGTYIFPSQPLSERIRVNSDSDLVSFQSILIGLIIIKNNIGDFLDIDEVGEQSYGWDGDEFINWVDKIQSIIGKDKGCTYNERVNPTWYYFRSFESGVSVVKSKTLPVEIKTLYLKNKTETKIIDGVSASLYITKDLRNCLDNKRLDLAKKIINILEGKIEVIVIPNENISFVLGNQHIVSVTNDGGISAFLDQKEKVMLRNTRENEILFSDRRMKWTILTRKDSALFEDLILELLSREPYIISAKKVAPTNQGDNGRDIICDYNKAYTKSRVSEKHSSIEIGKLIVQCKTNLNDSNKKSIGKSDVGIADTIYDYAPDGYLLVVNSQATRDLTEYLEKIRERGHLHWIEWWNSFDIEERLRMNPDIMSRYKDLIYYS